MSAVEMNKKQVYLFSLMLCIAAAVGSGHFLACKQEKGIYQFFQTFSTTSNNPTKSFPGFFYSYCPIEYKLPEDFYVKRTCGIPDEVQISKGDLNAYRQRTISCTELKEKVEARNQESERKKIQININHTEIS